MPLCNEHHLRELKFLYEEHQENWAQAMSTLLLDSLAHRKDQGVLDQAQFRKLQAQYRAILSQGRQRHPRRTGHGAQGKATNLLNRLEDFDLNVLAFTLFEEVPFTNNGAERDIRMEKTRQKILAAFAPCTGPESLPGFAATSPPAANRVKTFWTPWRKPSRAAPSFPQRPQRVRET